MKAHPSIFLFSQSQNHISHNLKSTFYPLNQTKNVMSHALKLVGIISALLLLVSSAMPCFAMSSGDLNNDGHNFNDGKILYQESPYNLRRHVHHFTNQMLTTLYFFTLSTL
jgi:hypothetical protein